MILRLFAAFTRAVGVAAFLAATAFGGGAALAEKYAAIVIDADTQEVLHDLGRRVLVGTAVDDGRRNGTPVVPGRRRFGGSPSIVGSTIVALVITRSRHGTGTPSPQASDTVIAPTAQSNTALRRVRRPVPFHSSAAADQTATPATTAASAHQTTLTTPAKTVRSSRYPARGSTREVRAEG